jgi:DNA-binding MarR family transcriptional regulator
MGDIGKELNSKFPNEWVKALINLQYTSHWFDSIGAELLQPFKISIQQYNILRILRGAGKAITVNTVKERMIQKSPNATRLMDKLCDKKLIDRMRCDNDRRVVYAKITDKGLDLLEKVKFDNFELQMRKISEAEAKQLNELLNKIR